METIYCNIDELQENLDYLNKNNLSYKIFPSTDPKYTYKIVYINAR